MTPKEKLIKEATAFGVKTEGLTVDQLKSAIIAFKAEKESELTVLVQDAKTEFEALGDDATSEVIAAAQEKIELAEKTLADFLGVPLENKSEESGVVEINGTQYAFKKTAPERFNFLGANKTQEEWLQDKDAMELLILGNSSYVKPLKK